MAHRVKCPECRSCMSPAWILPNRYYYCGFCHVYYGGRDSELVIVESPYKDKVEDATKVLDPIEEADNDSQEESGGGEVQPEFRGISIADEQARES